MKRNILLPMALAAILLAPQVQAKTRKHNLENPQVKAFYDQVTYPDDDYSYSLVKKYSQKTLFCQPKVSKIMLSALKQCSIYRI